MLVEPELLAMLATHAAGDNGASGELRVILAWDDTTSAAADLIISQGGVRETDIYDPEFPWADRIWRIPAESMLAVVQHPDVWAADLWKDGQKEQRQRPGHPKLNRTANLVVTAWHLGVPAENAAQYALFARGDRVLITMEAGNGPDFEELITWLESEEIYILDKAKAGSFSFQGLAKPRMAKAWPGAQPMRRIAAAMLVSPPLRSSPKTTLRNAAIT